MHLIQVLLPLYDNPGQPLSRDLFRTVAAELTERFGGLTAYTRAPAEGLWKEDAKTTTRDEVVLFEVMAAELDRDWWRNYRDGLEERFRQDQVLIRAQAVEVLRASGSASLCPGCGASRGARPVRFRSYAGDPP